MFNLTFYLLTLSTVGYVCGAVASLCYLRHGVPRLLSAARSLIAAGCVGLLGVFLLRWIGSGLLPMASAADSLVLFVFMATVVCLAGTISEDRRALMCFYWPAVALIACGSVVAARRDFTEPPKTFEAILLGIHVSLAMLAYAMSLAASLTSLAYAFQANRLKRRKTTGLFRRLPSLQEMDATLYQLIWYGYPMFVVTLWLGLLWAWIDSGSLSSTWWWSPKIFLALAMALMYSLSFHARRRGWLSGPKLAHFIFVGLTVVLAAYLLLSVFHLKNYNFWSPAA